MGTYTKREHTRSGDTYGGGGTYTVKGIHGTKTIRRKERGHTWKGDTYVRGGHTLGGVGGVGGRIYMTTRNDGIFTEKGKFIFRFNYCRTFYSTSTSYAYPI